VRRRILLIEDDFDTREIARIILELHGYEPQEADNSKTALEMILASPPDLVIMDLAIKPLSGWDLFREIRARGPRSLPLIAFSGYSGGEGEATIREFGFDGYIPKPCSPDRIVSEVKKFLP